MATTAETVVDRLDDIFKTQARFQQRLGTLQPVDFTRDILTAEDAHRVFSQVENMARCIMMEGAELMDWTPWKTWSIRLGNKREDVVPWSAEHLHEMRLEVADILCFLLNAALALGMTAADLYRIYMEKAAINDARQDQGSY